jgi:hypothetical protein
MFDAAQPIEKNHFPATWNRSTVDVMVASRAPSRLFVLKLIAAAIALATIAPMVVLASQV